METIKDQVEYGLENQKDYYQRLLALKKEPEWQDSLKSLEEQIRYQRRLIQKKVKTDSLEARISQRIRKAAKLYHYIEGYYEEEVVLTKYILQIIKQAMEEAENE